MLISDLNYYYSQNSDEGLNRFLERKPDDEFNLLEDYSEQPL